MTDEEKEIKLVTERCPCCGTKANPKKIKDTCENCLETCFDQWRHKVADFEKENEQLKAQIEKMKNVGNCKYAMQCPNWVKHKIKNDGIKPCLNCIKWELEE